MAIVKSGPGLRKCCTLPHGVLSVVPMLVAPVALTLALIASLSCNFLQQLMIETFYSAAAYDDFGNITHIDKDVYKTVYKHGLLATCSSSPGGFEFRYSSKYFNDYHDSGYYNDYDSDSSGSYSSGSYRYYTGGRSPSLTSNDVRLYPFNPFIDPDYNDQTEQKFRSATAFAFLSIIIGGMAASFMILGTCIAYRRVARFLMASGFAFASLLSFLMLIVFNSKMCNEKFCLSSFRNQTRVAELDLEYPLDDVCSEGCRAGPGAGVAVGAGIFWLICAVITFALQDAVDDDGDYVSSASGGAEPKRKKNPGAPSTTEEKMPLAKEPEIIYQYHQDQSGNIIHPEQAPRSFPQEIPYAHDIDQGLHQVSPPGRHHKNHHHHHQTDDNIETEL